MSNRPPAGLSAWERVEWHGWTVVQRVADLGPCWEFDGPKMGKGYGSVQIDGRAYLAHRISFDHHNPPLKPCEVARHRCDNKTCVNPDHIERGSRADNNRDARERGQWKPQRGEEHGCSKLTQADVDKIRSLYAHREGERRLTQTAIAQQFGVTQSNISHIINGRKWKENA